MREITMAPTRSTYRPQPVPTRTRAGPLFQKLSPADHVIRAIVAMSAAATARVDTRRPDPEEIAEERWPADQVTPIIIRTATSPATPTATGWAADLVTGAVPDLLQSLAPPSAAGSLFGRAHMWRFDRSGFVQIPGM